MKRILFVILGLALLTGIPCQAGDLPLTIVPVLAASTPDPYQAILKLSGDWYFTVHFSTPDVDEFRFYKNTINLNDPVYCFIDGDQYLNNFSVFYEDKVMGEYVKKSKFYTVVSLWGPPDYDLGSAYVFKSADKDTPAFDCHYFIDGQGHVQNYYIGFGGTVPCEPLTKKRRNGSKMKRPGKNVSPQVHKKIIWENHLENIHRNKTQKSKLLPDSSQALQIQSQIDAALQQINK